jgi:hypothetical protein
VENCLLDRVCASHGLVVVLVLLNDGVYERNCRGEFFFDCAYIHAGGNFLVLNVLYVRCRSEFSSNLLFLLAANQDVVLNKLLSIVVFKRAIT